MALTFTNKAAREMKSRVEFYAGRSANKILMGTFHSVFSRILRIHADLLGYTSDYSIYDTADSKSRIRTIIKDMGLDDKSYRPNSVYNRISSAKNKLISAQAYGSNIEFAKYDAQCHMPRISEIYSRYSIDLKKSNAMDFDDLLMNINILFRDHPEVLKRWQERIDYLLIDEYQDTNFAQYMIAKQIMGEKGKIFVVGDDAQSIYSFRGANLDNILGFKNSFKDAKLFKLEQNYRSTQTIVQVAGSLIAHNEEQIPKEVFSENVVGEPVVVHEAFTAELEAAWVVNEIRVAKQSEGVPYSASAILYRTNAQSRILEQELRKRNVPFRIYGGRSFFDHKEVKDVIAYFRLLVNPNDEESLLRVINYPKRGIGSTTVDKLRTTANQSQIPISEIINDPLTHNVSISKATATKISAFSQMLTSLREEMDNIDFVDFAQNVIRTTGISSDIFADNTAEGITRQENLKELILSIEEYQQAREEEDQKPTLASYLAEISLMTDQDSNTSDGEMVTLMTIHSAKGLEFPHVYIVGLEEQLFPSPMSSEGRELEEERRLFYVAITRAEQTCHIAYARERFRNGRTESVRPSRFLSELSPSLIRYISLSDNGNLWRQGLQKRNAIPDRFDTETDRSFLPQRPKGRKVPIGTRTLQGDSFPQETQHSSIGDLSVGDKVLHHRFGLGVIELLEGDGENAKATVVFDQNGSKKLLLRFAKLRKV